MLNRTLNCTGKEEETSLLLLGHRDFSFCLWIFMVNTIKGMRRQNEIFINPKNNNNITLWIFLFLYETPVIGSYFNFSFVMKIIVYFGKIWTIGFVKQEMKFVRPYKQSSVLSWSKNMNCTGRDTVLRTLNKHLCFCYKQTSTLKQTQDPDCIGIDP